MTGEQGERVVGRLDRIADALARIAKALESRETLDTLISILARLDGIQDRLSEIEQTIRNSGGQA